jgi:hypothetical protein
MKSLNVIIFCFLLTFVNVLQASILKDYKNLIASCSAKNAASLVKSFEVKVTGRFDKMNLVEKSKSFYGDSLESQLHSIFSVGVYEKEPKRLRPLIMCWMILYDWERADKAKKKQHLTEWRACLDRVYRPKSQVAHELFNCLSQAE